MIQGFRLALTLPALLLRFQVICCLRFLLRPDLTDMMHDVSQVFAD